MSGQTKFSQEASDNTYFRLDLSQVVEYDEIYPPAHNLETYDDSDSDENEEYSNNLLSNKYRNQSTIKWELLWAKTLVLFIK